jgi:hypothetical protein
MTEINKDKSLVAAGRQLDWKDVVSSFRVISAKEILLMKEMKRYQDVRDKIRWLTVEEQP